MFDQINQIKGYLELAEMMQKMDANKNGVADWQEYLARASKIADLSGKLQVELAEIGELFGDNVEAVKAKLGVKD